MEHFNLYIVIFLFHCTKTGIDLQCVFRVKPLLCILFFYYLVKQCRIPKKPMLRQCFFLLSFLCDNLGKRRKTSSHDRLRYPSILQCGEVAGKANQLYRFDFILNILDFSQ